MNLKSALQLTHYEKHYKIEQPFLSARPQIWQQMTVSAGDWGEGFRYCCLLSLAKTKKVVRLHLSELSLNGQTANHTHPTQRPKIFKKLLGA